MRSLKEIVTNGESLAEGLRNNGSKHQNYRLYTSMERALGIMVSGYLYLSNGKNWNDAADESLMSVKKAYAICFSCSTKENIAMWMLYGANHGKQGAMLNFYPSVLRGIMDSEIVEMGCFDNHHKFNAKYTLNKSENDFEVFLSDIVYTDMCDNGKVQLTIADEHITADHNVLNNSNVFHKNYAWSYEKECRLIVRTTEIWNSKANREGLSFVRIKIPTKMMAKMKENRLFRSPVYEGGVSNGLLSALTNDVNWYL